MSDYKNGNLWGEVSQEPASHANTYRPDIDGLRAIAILCVLIYHTFPQLLPNGFIGVDLFFVISGFLVTRIVLQQRENNFSFKKFYYNRAKRILPALVIVLAATLFIGYFVLFRDEFKMLGKYVLAASGFSSNIIFYLESGYFDVTAHYKPLLHLWSLGVEEQFYICFPLFMLVLAKLKIPVRPVLIVGTALSFVGSLIAMRYNTSFAFYMPFTRAWELLAGGILSTYPLGDGRTRRSKGQTSLYDLLFLLGAGCLVCGILFTRKDNFPGYWAVLPVAFSVLIIIAGGISRLGGVLLGNRVMAGIGLISYPLYLWHWPLLSFSRILSPQEPPALTRLIIAVLSVTLAFLTYKIVEKPVRFG